MQFTGDCPLVWEFPRPKGNVIGFDSGPRFNSHSQFAFSGAKILSTSILRRPCEVARMVSGATPISLPTLDSELAPDWDTSAVKEKDYIRMPMFDDSCSRINNGAVHVEEKPVEGDSDGRLPLLQLRAHCQLGVL